MINILIPIAGHAKRFVDAGYVTPKPLILVDEQPMIQLAVDSLIKKDFNKYKLIFVVLEEHIVNHQIDTILKNLFSQFEVLVLSIPAVTEGTLCTCIEAQNYIDPNEPLVIYTPDIRYESNFDIFDDFTSSNLDGLLLTFKANSKDHSYAVIVNDLVIQTAEKTVVSNDAIVGVYCYKKSRYFFEYAQNVVVNKEKVNNEYYIAPMYNKLIANGLNIGSYKVDKMYVLGTPKDLEFYKEYVSKYRNINEIALCCDHSGYDLKERLKSLLTISGIKYVDFGTFSPDNTDHYYFLKPSIEYVLSNKNVLGISSCATGQAFNIAANKHKGIRSALVSDKHGAEMARRHNAANFISLAGNKNFTDEELIDILNIVMLNSFDGGRHTTRIMLFEQDNNFIK